LLQLSYASFATSGKWMWKHSPCVRGHAPSREHGLEFRSIDFTTYICRGDACFQIVLLSRSAVHVQ
jgi:hypothetical protein